MTRTHRRWHAWLWLLLGPIILTGFIVGVLTRPAQLIEPSRLSYPGEAKKSSTEPQPREGTP